MSAVAFEIVGGSVTCLAVVQLGYWLLWTGLLLLSVSLVVLLWTRWGQSRPLQKCALLSLIVHLILAFLAMTVRIVNGDAAAGGGGGGTPIHVRIVEDAGPSPAGWTAVDSRAVVSQAEEMPAPPLLEAPRRLEEPRTPAKVEPANGEPAPTLAPVDLAEAHEPKVVKTEVSRDEFVSAVNPIVATAANPADLSAESATAEKDVIARAPVDSPVARSPLSNQTPAASLAMPVVAGGEMPSVYALRNGMGKMSVIAGQGGDAQTERAVTAALAWLAKSQSPDGRWDAVQHGAGHEELVLGENRGGAGRNADTGITALALLAFLGAGHSHLQGQYQETVQRGVDFLLRSQAADGSLFGEATLYAQMYCHSMATFALAEAQAMSNDRRLERAVRSAVNYSLAAQNTATGGWRYRPGDAGDTSQLGWQIMALASAKRAGVGLPDITWTRVSRFMQTVQRGKHGGLASYRPDSPMTTSMTAEAFYCRLMLQELNGIALDDAAADEATAQLLASLPNAERTNLYYWYYASLALHHHQLTSESATAAWRRWNAAMAATLTTSQIGEGENAGSWTTNTIWGGYGGRVYTTAMATMCLEVYYRYAPAAVPGRVSSAAKTRAALK